MADRDGARTLAGVEGKFTALDLKSVADDGTFEGYASLFGREDLGRDIVMAGAFKDSLARRGVRGVRMLFQHDPTEPIGAWEDLREDGKGLFARGRLMREVARAREILSLMRAGALDGLSIGFKAEKARRDAKTGVRRIERADLWEISIVTFPMLPEARVANVKSSPFGGAVPSERELERWLTRSAGMTRAQACALMRNGIKGLHALRDAGGDGSEAARIAGRMRDAAQRMRIASSSKKQRM